MDEIIVRAARALPHMPRLRILSRLARSEEANPTNLARELGMGLNVVCTHLRTLSTAALIQRRKSGTWCYYRAESPYGERTFSGRLTTWLGEVLRSSSPARKNLGPREVRDIRLTPEDAEVHRLLFESATAFTDLRRLQILRYLSGHETAAASHLMTELSMSREAVRRHMQKLTHRGYVVTLKGRGVSLAYQLASTFKTPVHAEMFGIVRSTWEQKHHGPREVRDTSARPS